MFAIGASIGVVICNAAREVMAALSTRGVAVNDSEEVEVVAYRSALEFAIDAGFSELIIEGDNATIMSAVSSSSPNWSRLGFIYDDVHCLATALRHIVFNCIRHSANPVAHSLAHYANVLDEEVVWLEESPPPTCEALLFDSSFINE